MISLSVDLNHVRRLQASVRAAGKSFSKEMAAALNATARKTQVAVGKAIRQEALIPVKESKKAISLKGHATPYRLQATVRVQKAPRLGLRHFGARQDKKGVSYKIARQGGRQRRNGAFMGPRPGVVNPRWQGEVFVRVSEARGPLRMLKGVSAWGVCVKNDIARKQMREAKTELRKQMERRITLNVLRANGLKR